MGCKVDSCSHGIVVAMGEAFIDTTSKTADSDGPQQLGSAAQSEIGDKEGAFVAKQGGVWDGVKWTLPLGE